MKRLISGKALLILVGLAALTCAAVPANAASYMRATIPFPFFAGNENLPAGEYLLRTDVFQRLLIQSRADNRLTWVSLSPRTSKRSIDKSAEGMLQFRLYGDIYVLSGVWKPGSAEGNQVARSKREIQMGQAHPPGIATLVVAAK